MKTMNIWKRVPRRQLKNYHAREEPVLVTAKRVNPNRLNNPQDHGVLWDWEPAFQYQELMQSARLSPELRDQLRLLAPTGFMFGRQLAVNTWREAFSNCDYAEPVFWAKDYELMSKVKKYYREKKCK